MRASPPQLVAGCFPACVTGYAYASPKERLPTLPDMWYDVPPVCQPSMPRAASRVTCARVPMAWSSPLHVAMGGRVPAQPLAVLAVQHKEVSPVQRSAVDAQLRDRAWQCEDSQALT